MKNINAIIAIAFRDITKLLRDKTRIVASLIFPAIFIGVLGLSLQQNLGENLAYNYLVFIFVGVLAQTLFQSTAGGIISLVEDRQNDFAQEMFVAPISRYSILFGKILGETLVSFILVLGVLFLGVVMRIPLDIGAMFRLLPFTIGISLFGGAFGVLVMSFFSDQKSASQIFPFLLFPQFFLAGVFNPIQKLPLPLLIASRIAPMTYAVDLMRSVYFLGDPAYKDVVIFGPVIDLSVIIVLSVVFLSLGTWMFIKKERDR